MIEKINMDGLFAPQVDLWQTNLDRYAHEKKIKMKKNSFCFAGLKDKSSTTDMSLILARVAIADMKKEDEKYVVLQTFFDQGKMGTIDLIGLPLKNHVNIVHEYLESVLTPLISRQLLPVREGFSRYITSGGFASQGKDKIKFHGSSGDFGNQISTYNVNDIAAFLASESRLFEQVEPGCQTHLERGKNYLGKCLDIMRENKGNPEFYGKLVDLYFCDNMWENEEVSSQTLYALHTMKSIDRALDEGKEISQVVVEELVDGIGRDMIRALMEKMGRRE